MYECWTCCDRDLTALLVASRLSLTAWQLLGPLASPSSAERRHFVSEFLYMQSTLDTKDTNFFFRYTILF